MAAGQPGEDSYYLDFTETSPGRPLPSFLLWSQPNGECISDLETTGGMGEGWRGLHLFFRYIDYCLQEDLLSAPASGLLLYNQITVSPGPAAESEREDLLFSLPTLEGCRPTVERREGDSLVLSPGLGAPSLLQPSITTSIIRCPSGPLTG